MKKTSAQQYKYLPFLTMLYVTIMLAVTVLSNKIIIISSHISMAGTLFIPFFFVLSDIIAEIYGYKMAKKIIWIAFLCHLIFAFLCTIAIHMPSPNFWVGQKSYELVLGNQFRLMFSGFLAYITS